MNSQVKEMLENCYTLFCDKFKDNKKAWDSFLEFIAADQKPMLIWKLNHKFEWLFKDTSLVKALDDMYRPEILKSDYYDHLGSLYFEKVIKIDETDKKTPYLISDKIVETMGNNSLEKKYKLVNILDPAVGTGRSLMTVYKRCSNGSLFGVDNDINLIRIALANFIIHDIPGHLLYADRNRHEIDISKENGKYNWQFANQWNSQQDKLKSVETILSTIK